MNQIQSVRGCSSIGMVFASFPASASKNCSDATRCISCLVVCFACVSGESTCKIQEKIKIRSITSTIFLSAEACSVN